jgi:Tfp pilus assembly protein PilO
LLHYAGVAVVLVCGATGYGWLYTPVETDIFDTVMKIEELALSRQNADVIRREHARLSSHLRNIDARYAALEQRVPVNAEAGSFLKHVSEIAREENLDIGNFQPAQSVEGDGFTAMEVMLDGKGSFESICSFFERLSKIQRLSKVKDLSVSVDPRSDSYPMKATIVIYFGLKGDGAEPTPPEVSRG